MICRTQINKQYKARDYWNDISIAMQGICDHK